MCWNGDNMGTAADGIEEDPENGGASADDQQMEAWLDENTIESSTEEPEELPSRSELWQVVQEQQDQIEQMQERIEDLEATVDEVQFEADTIEEVAEKFRDGTIGGEAGAEFLREFVSTPDHTTKVDARASQLFFTIVRERRVGKPVRSKDVVRWLELHDSSNPSVAAKRVMDRMERHRDDGHYIGAVRSGKHRGQNCIWLDRTAD